MSNNKHTLAMFALSIAARLTHEEIARLAVGAQLSDKTRDAEVKEIEARITLRGRSTYLSLLPAALQYETEALRKRTTRVMRTPRGRAQLRHDIAHTLYRARTPVNQALVLVVLLKCSISREEAAETPEEELYHREQIAWTHRVAALLCTMTRDLPVYLDLEEIGASNDEEEQYR